MRKEGDAGVYYTKKQREHSELGCIKVIAHKRFRSRVLRIFKTHS